MEDLNSSTENISTLSQLLKELDEKKKKDQPSKFTIIKTCILTILAFALIILLLLYLIYLLERYVVFYPIKKLIELILKIFISSKNIYLKKYVFNISLVISIFLHIKFFQILILSFIFLGGGLFSRFQFYSQLSCLISVQRHSAISLSVKLLFDNNEEMNEIFQNIFLFHKAYINQKKNNNETFEINKYQFGECLNNLITLFNKYKEKNYKDEEIKKSLDSSLDKYREIIDHYDEFNCIDILFKLNYSKYQNFIKELLLISFENRECNKVAISDNFNAYIISPEKKIDGIKTLFIYCGQNAFNVEMLSINKYNLELFFGIKELTILVWNYPGYGSRKGFPSFKKIDKDVQELKNYIIKNFIAYKIIIHGISIGGYPAIKLCKILQEYNGGDFRDNICLIADRTFSDIDLIAESFSQKIGKGLKFIYNILFPKLIYHSNNLINYINLPIENKFIFFDENDSIISYYKSSLIYNITLKYYEEIILPKISKYKEYAKLNNMSNENFKNIKIHMKHIINSVSDINFNNFVKSMNKNDIKSFLMYFLIFGYPINIYKEIFYDKKNFDNKFVEIPIILKNIYENNKIIFNTILYDFFSDINFLFIKCNLVASLDDKQIKNFKYNNDIKDFAIDENIDKNKKKYFGYVHRIFCEHNGTLEKNDEAYIIDYLKLKGFIKSE